MSILIVLFGQENDPDGKLLPPAMARCIKAAELFRELSPGSEVVILPTAGFGNHFNISELPHFFYLTRELVRLGVPPENVLPGVNSSNTLQDATEAWYRFKSGGFHRLVAVTSDYHAARVAFILGRLSANDAAEIEVVPVDTPAGYTGRDREIEPQKLETLRREWVDVIPRSANAANERAAKVYEQAGREHQHYDTLSLAVVSAIFIINAFAMSVLPGKSGWTVILLLVALAAADLLLWSLYNRMADAARTARRVLSRMEIEHRMPGFSSNWRPQTAEWFRSPPWQWSMKELVTALVALLFLSAAILALTGERTDARDNDRPASLATSTNSVTSPTPAASATANALDRWANRVLGPEGNANANSNRRRR